MKNVRMMSLILAIMTVLTLMGGPALAESAGGTESTESAGTAESTDQTQASVTGRVTAVSESAITMELGAWTAQTAPGQNADASSSATVQPENAAPKSTAPDAGATPDNSATSNNNATPDSSAPADSSAAPQDDAAQSDTAQSGDASGFTASGETLTFALTDSTAITLQGRNAKGSLSDITIGSILTVELTDGTATSITVIRTSGMSRHDGFGHSGGPGQGNWNSPNGAAPDQGGWNGPRRGRR